MKLAVVGCGAIGSYYGAKLSRAGHDTHFLLRSDFAAVQAAGVTIRSVEGDFQVHPIPALKPEEIGVCGVVLIGLKTTANAQFPHLLPPLVGPRTTVATLQNGLGNVEALARLFPPDQILGGLCFVCLNRVAPGVIHHLAEGMVVLGEFQPVGGQRLAQLVEVFCAAGIRCQATDDLARAHWEKLVWNIPFNGLGVAGVAGYEAVISGVVSSLVPTGPVLTTDKLLGEARWQGLVYELMLEVIATAGALGKPIPVSWADQQIERTRKMVAYKASTLLDFEQGRPLELESVFLEPLRRAATAGVATPRLGSLCRVLCALNSRPTAITSIAV